MPTLGKFRDRYLETHGSGTLEETTIRGICKHFRHLAHILGERFPIRDLELSDLQQYVTDVRKKTTVRHRAKTSQFSGVPQVVFRQAATQNAVREHLDGNDLWHGGFRRRFSPMSDG